MSASLTIPLATSQRTIAVKVMDENRRIINQHRTLLGSGKVSYTHIIGWAIVKALEEMPALNHAYAETGRPAVPRGASADQPGHRRRRRRQGRRAQPAWCPTSRTPARSISQEYRDRLRRPGGPRAQRQADPRRFPGHHHFADQSRHGGHHGLQPAPDARARAPSSPPAPSTIPAEYQGAAAETRAMLGISKVMTLTCTYDHRIIQGAESGRVPGQACRRCWTAATASTKRSSRT